MTTLTAPRPYAWDTTAAAQHLPAQVRRELPAGSSLVPIGELDLLVNYAQVAVEKNHIILVSGRAGTGKTTLVGALEGISAVHVANVSITPNRRAKQVWQELALGVTGAPQPGTEVQLQDKVARTLAQTPTLLIVDEAQNVSLESLLALRWLNNKNLSHVGMVLAGVNLNERFEKEPQLSTRVKRRILLERRTWPQMHRLLTQFHPILAASEPGLLARVDKAFARGLWRYWQHFVDAAVDDLGATTEITYDVAEDAIFMVRGRRPDLRAIRDVG